YYGPHLDELPERTGSVLQAIARAEPGGVLFHCAGGRDRTGIIALALLSGCASGSSGSSEKVDNLTFWLSTSTAQEKGYQDLATAYEKKTGVTVKIVNLPYDGLQTKLRESAKANSHP
ncbi:extracellular solute-binding protein, partial [Bacillus sp. S34]|nr:extracellular solute-binding protein [Bacillus sp. S34]